MAQKIVLLNVPLLTIPLRDVVDYFSTRFAPCPIDEELTGTVHDNGIVLAVKNDNAVQDILEKGSHSIPIKDGQAEVLTVPYIKDAGYRSAVMPWRWDQQSYAEFDVDGLIMRQQEHTWNEIMGVAPPAYDSIDDDPVVSSGSQSRNQKLLRNLDRSCTLDVPSASSPGVLDEAETEDTDCDVRSIMVESVKGEGLELKELIKFFSDTKATGGGLLNNTLCYLQAYGRKAVITFRTPDVAARVLANERITNVPPRNIQIKVTSGKPQPSPNNDPYCLIIYNASLGTPNSALELLAKSEAHLSQDQKAPVVCFRGNLGTGEVALLQFQQNIKDLDGVIAGINATPYCGVRHIAKKLSYTNCILLENVADIHLDQIRLLVEIRVGRHRVALIEGDDKNSAFVFFTNYSAVSEVLRHGDFHYRGRTITCYPFLSQLNLPLGRQGTRPVSVLAPFLLNAEPIYVQCICAHQKYFDEFTKRLKEDCSADLEVKRDDDPDFIELEAHYVGSKDNVPTEEQWSRSINAVLNATVSKFERRTVICPRSQWNSLMEQIRPEAAEWYVVLEEDDNMVLTFCGRREDVEEHIDSATAIIAAAAPPSQQVEERKVVYASDQSMNIEILVGDLSSQRKKIIAVEVDENLKPKDSVGKALISKAGLGVLSEREKHIERSQVFPVASVLETSAGSLPGVSTILHVVTPRWSSSNRYECEQQLRSTFVRCLTYAGRELNSDEICMPPLGAGRDSFPLEIVGKILFETSYEKRKDKLKLRNISIVCGDELSFKDIPDAKHKYQARFKLLDDELELSGGAVSTPVKKAESFSRRTGLSRLFGRTGVPPVKNPLKGMETLYEFYTAENIRVQICVGNVITEKSGAIVSSANRNLNHAFGVAKAIAGAAGQEYLDECKKVLRKHKGKRLDTKECVHTGAGRLEGTKYIIHAVGPNQSKAKDEEWNRLLEETIVNALVLANTVLHVDSVSLPLIGTGVQGVSVTTVAGIMYKAIVKYSSSVLLTNRHLTCIRLFDKGEEKQLNLAKIFREKSQNDREYVSEDVS